MIATMLQYTEMSEVSRFLRLTRFVHKRCFQLLSVLFNFWKSVHSLPFSSDIIQFSLSNCRFASDINFSIFLWFSFCESVQEDSVNLHPLKRTFPQWNQKNRRYWMWLSGLWCQHNTMRCFSLIKHSYDPVTYGRTLVDLEFQRTGSITSTIVSYLGLWAYR